MPVKAFESSRVAVPLGATTPRPVVIALHGDADRPEWPCGTYHFVVRSRAFVLCPRGVPAQGDRFKLGAVETTGRELRAALPALKARFGEYVTKGPVVLAAIGPAVDHALEIARGEPGFFAYLVLVDGSLDRLTYPIVKQYADGGGKRVLFLCTRAGCDGNVASRVLALRGAGVDARVERISPAVGLDGEAAKVLRQNWAWLVSDDLRWR